MRVTSCDDVYVAVTVVTIVDIVVISIFVIIIIIITTTTGDSTLHGLYMMAMTGNHTAMATANTVFLKHVRALLCS